MLAYFYWDPSPEMFSWSLPLLHRPILWYGFLFALGFLLAYYTLLSFLKQETSQPRKIADQITFYGVIGIIVGARLFDVIFYENWEQFAHHPTAVLAVWHGGLASHGGVLGLMIALLIFQRRSSFCPFLHLLDLLIMPAAIAAFFIRIGNFVNQEILGKPSHLPWAVIFGHPIDGSPPIPRHPVQLYEALFYLLVFLLLALLKKSWRRWRAGKACGAFLMLIFAFRFCIEFLKEEQSYHLAHGLLTMGQWLSIPLFLVGAVLFFRKKR